MIAILVFLALIPVESNVVAVAIPSVVVQEDTTEIDTAYMNFMEEFPPFTFSTFEIELHEGCTDSLVYPGGASGPTISCGLDLGNAGMKTVSAVLKHNVPDSIYDILIKATKIRGDASQDWIRRNQVHIGQHNANILCNKVKKIIWQYVTSRYPNIENAPPEAKTAMLDIAFQAGVGSKRMDGFSKVIENSDWRGLGVLIENSYNDFAGGRYHSIYKRRVAHGKSIQFVYDPPKNAPIDYD